MMSVPRNDPLIHPNTERVREMLTKSIESDSIVKRDNDEFICDSVVIYNARACHLYIFAVS